MGTAMTEMNVGQQTEETMSAAMESNGATAGAVGAVSPDNVFAIRGDMHSGEAEKAKLAALQAKSDSKQVFSEIEKMAEETSLKARKLAEEVIINGGTPEEANKVANEYIQTVIKESFSQQSPGGAESQEGASVEEVAKAKRKGEIVEDLIKFAARVQNDEVHTFVLASIMNEGQSIGIRSFSEHPLTLLGLLKFALQRAERELETSARG